jgi:hypothetical protein
MQYICKVNKAQTKKQNDMKATIKEQLDNANEGLCNAHYYLSEAIKNNNTMEEDYWFKSVWRFSELIDKLERKLNK